LLAFLRRDAVGRISKIDRAIRLDHDIVRTIETFPSIPVCQGHRLGAGFGARDAPTAMLAGNDTSLVIERETVGMTAWFTPDGYAFGWMPAVLTVGGDV
jgi:hypothetical protein